MMSSFFLSGSFVQRYLPMSKEGLFRMKILRASSTDAGSSASAVAKSIGLNTINRHIFLCADQTKPKCCQLEASLESWNFLKKRMKELKLGGKVARTKANCLQVCVSGPIAVVYPDAVWYHSCTPENLELILQKHMLNGEIVEELRFDAGQGFAK